MKKVLLVLLLTVLILLMFGGCKKTPAEMWDSEKFLKKYDNLPNEVQLIVSFNYKDEVKPSPLYSVYKTYLLETELGTKFKTIGDYEKYLIPKSLVKDVVLQLFDIDESKINWQEFSIMEVEGESDSFGLRLGFDGGYLVSEVLYDTLTYSPDTNIVTFDIKFTDDAIPANELYTLKYKFQPFMYKDKIQQYKFMSVERVS